MFGATDLTIFFELPAGFAGLSFTISVILSYKFFRRIAARLIALEQQYVLVFLSHVTILALK